MGNPPFNDKQEHDGKKEEETLLSILVVYSLNILKEKTEHLSFVHPAAWRKPTENSKNKGLFKLMAKDNSIKYLEIHNTDDGMRTFNGEDMTGTLLIKN